MSCLAIITARGGSKRIPKKNIRNFCGKPIIAYSIEAAIGSGIFDEVMVSTDSEEIGDVALKYGAKVPFFRSEKTSNDFASTADVLIEVLDEYKKRDREFDSVACIYPTAPFVTAAKLLDAMNLFNKSGADTLLTVVKYSYPPQRSLVIQNGKVRFQYPQYEKSRSQDLEPVYHDCGQFYIMKAKSIFGDGKMICENTIPYILPEEEVQDIDTISDWTIAEAKYKAIKR